MSRLVSVSSSSCLRLPGSIFLCFLLSFSLRVCVSTFSVSSFRVLTTAFPLSPHAYVFPCLLLLLPLSVPFQSTPVCLSIFSYLCTCLSMSIAASVCPFPVDACLSVCLSSLIFVSVSPCLSLPLSVPFQSMPVYLSVYLSSLISVPVSPCLYRSLSLSILVSVSPVPILNAI